MESLRKWWSGLSPMERRAIMFGVPVVAIAAVVSMIRGREDAAAEDAADGKAGTDATAGTYEPATPPPGPGGTGAAIGVDQLADFQNQFTGALDEVYGTQDALASALTSQLENVTGQLEQSITDLSGRIANGDENAAGDDDTPTVEPATQPDRRPRAGWDYVRDNLDAEFVVKWSNHARYRVHPRDADRARAIFGSPLTRVAQTPADHRNAQRAMVKDELGGNLPGGNGRISLDARMGWESAGQWTNQGTR